MLVRMDVGQGGWDTTQSMREARECVVGRPTSKCKRTFVCTPFYRSICWDVRPFCLEASIEWPTFGSWDSIPTSQLIVDWAFFDKYGPIKGFKINQQHGFWFQNPWFNISPVIPAMVSHHSFRFRLTSFAVPWSSSAVAQRSRGPADRPSRFLWIGRSVDSS